jgi:EAL domain-containing protein (putative c-di-GMP-specific phosphodiesterase class I)
MRAFLRNPLVLATIVACICGLLLLDAPLNHIYWNVQSRFGKAEAPKSIILVNVDDSERGSLTGTELVRLVKVLGEQLPQKIYFDQPTNIPESAALAHEFQELGGRVKIVVRTANAETARKETLGAPDPAVFGDTGVVYSGWYLNFTNFVAGAPAAIKIREKVYPSFAYDLADRTGQVGSYFIPDFSLDPMSIRQISAEQIIKGKITHGLLAGRTVIVTSARTPTGGFVGFFGHGRVNPVVVDVAGALSVEGGSTASIGRLPLLLLLLASITLARRIAFKRVRWPVYAGVVACIFVAPAGLRMFGLYSSPSSALITAVVYGGIRLWTKWRRRVQHTSASGLPNFIAFTEQPIPMGHDIVVATIGRYEEFLATLPAELHGECAQQIARRFAVVSSAGEIFHGEGGYFGWTEPSADPEQQIEHFEGLRALFSAPLLIGGHMFDTNVHFGLDRNYGHDAPTRINTALASASEALKTGRTIEQFETKRLADAPWELSLMARIDEGLKNGDIWLAYQPQWDYRQMRISGAEALIRWNDPQRGAIRPDAFIMQAEKAGRIDALTWWVMDEAISAAEEINSLGPDFQMSINLSAQLVDKRSLISSVSDIARRRGIDCRQFTIEITETASVYNRPAAVENLQQLRAMGFRLSIDDFGTGESSLLYLAELPSDELKIDQHFVSKILTYERERHIVASTIGLAHALGQTVVAEGIEDQATFELLRSLGCDTGQGYYIARPETLAQLRTRYLALRDSEGRMFTAC